jgi:hypothetical protein
MRRNRNKKNLPNEEKTETAIDIGDRLIEIRLSRQRVDAFSLFALQQMTVLLPPGEQTCG